MVHNPTEALNSGCMYQGRLHQGYNVCRTHADNEYTVASLCPVCGSRSDSCHNIYMQACWVSLDICLSAPSIDDMYSSVWRCTIYRWSRVLTHLILHDRACVLYKMYTALWLPWWKTAKLLCRQGVMLMHGIVCFLYTFVHASMIFCNHAIIIWIRWGLFADVTCE